MSDVFDASDDDDDDEFVDLRSTDLMPVSGHGSKPQKHRLVHRSGPHLVDGNNNNNGKGSQGLKHRLVHRSGPHLVDGNNGKGLKHRLVHKSGPHLVNGVDEETVERFRRQGFAAYNLRPKAHHGKRFRPQIYGPDPFMWDGEMWFRSKFSGTVPGPRDPEDVVTYWDPIKSTPPKQWTTGVPYRMPTVGKDPRERPKTTTNIFRIAYTIAYPASRKPKRMGREPELRDLPCIMLLHGVPMNRKLKFEIMKQLGKMAFVCTVDMLGMGESDMPHDYGKKEFPYEVPPKSKQDADNFNRAWDWEHDVPYMRLLMKAHLPKKYGLDPEKKWVFQADDWGAGILKRYLCEHPEELALGIFVNPIFLDGYFVIEIGTIGKLSAVWKTNPDAFMQQSMALPQIMLGIEKYMVLNRWKMNRYTEEQNLGTYQFTNYQAGGIAAHMPQNAWNLVVLADRSSRLAPRQLQPYDARSNPWGCRVENVKTPIEIIWGWQDQMMPPAQVWRAIYLFGQARVNYTPIYGADHLVEIDQPDKVVRAMWNAMQREMGKANIPIFLGNGDDVVFKGDEEELLHRLEDIYGAPNPREG